MYSLVEDCGDFFVIEKAPNVSLHHETSHSETQLNDDLSIHSLQKDNGLIRQLRKDFNSQYIFPVHRLDKATSGLLLCAKTSEANSQLSQLFQKRQVEKYYLALSFQKPKKKQGLIKGDMLKARNGSWKLSSSNDNPAITQFLSYSIGEQGKTKRLFMLKPHTGKTHQLRVALKSIGSSILGDKRYGHKNTKEERCHLHAYGLRFNFNAKEYCFLSTPSGDEFTKEFVEFVDNNLSTPWDLSWPTIKNKTV